MKVIIMVTLILVERAEGVTGSMTQWVMNEPLDPSLIFWRQDGLSDFNDMYTIISETKIQT